MMMRCQRWLGVLVISMLLLGVRAGAAQENKYGNAQDAYRAGIGFVVAKDLVKGREALEEALRSAPNDTLKLDIYRVLVYPYRSLPEIDKMIEAMDYIIANSESSAERSLTRSSLLSFVYQRGKVKQLIALYEGRLKASKDDETALYILSETYDRYSPNPRRGAEIDERLLALQQKDGKLDIRTASQLGQQYVRDGKFRAGAALFEKLAPLDKKLSAWHLKEAARAWLKANEKDKAVTAAKASAASRPEKRSEQLTYYWHKALADIFLETGEAALAIEHYEKALENTDIQGYRRDCLGRLAEARQKAGGEDKE